MKNIFFTWVILSLQGNLIFLEIFLILWLLKKFKLFEKFQPYVNQILQIAVSIFVTLAPGGGVLGLENVGYVRTEPPKPDP